MEWIEVSARTLPAAVELALDRLGVVEDELEYEVVDEPRSGLVRVGSDRGAHPGAGEAAVAGEARRPPAPKQARLGEQIE